MAAVLFAYICSYWFFVCLFDTLRDIPVNGAYVNYVLLYAYYSSFPLRATCVFSDNVYTFCRGMYLAVYGVRNLEVRTLNKIKLVLLSFCFLISSSVCK